MDIYFTLLHIQARKKNTEERKEQESVTRELIRIELVRVYSEILPSNHHFNKATS